MVDNSPNRLPIGARNLPEHPLLQRARTAEAIGDLEQALEMLNVAANELPDDVSLGLVKARVLRQLGRIEQAFQLCHALQIRHPDAPRPHLFEAGLHLLTGNYAAGWPKYRYRKVQTDWATAHVRIPEWTGQTLANKRLVIFGEQGLGDEIMFGSCVRDLLGMTSGLAWWTSPRVAELLAFSYRDVSSKAVELFSADMARDFDYRVDVGDLPSILRPTEACFYESRESYLHVPRAQRAVWRSRMLRRCKTVVGISWRGGKNPTSRERATSFCAWESLFRMPDVQFVVLQPSVANEQLAAVYGLMAGPNYLGDVAEYVSCVSALDLLITVDNTTAHIAGALGVKTWLLLACIPSWPWHISRPDSVWYEHVTAIRAGLGSDLDSLIPSLPSRLERWLDKKQHDA